MKEQDAAHSFEKKERCQYESWVNEYFGLPENFPERAMSMSFDYGQIVNMLAMFDEKRNDFHKQNVADVMFERDLEFTRLRSELQQAKQEIANHTLANSLLLDSDGEADLANKIYQLTSELQQEREKVKFLQQQIADLRERNKDSSPF